MRIKSVLIKRGVSRTDPGDLPSFSWYFDDFVLDETANAAVQQDVSIAFSQYNSGEAFITVDGNVGDSCLRAGPPSRRGRPVDHAERRGGRVVMLYGSFARGASAPVARRRATVVAPRYGELLLSFIVTTILIGG